MSAVMSQGPKARERSAYPPIEPHASGHLDVGDGHELYWETCGHPDGLPALFLHGGPGGGCSRADRRLFDPRRYRIVLFDQRGAGRSRPLGSIEANTTQALVADIERLRRHLGVEAWHVVLGGSWGATLALAYAQVHADRVRALVLRGVFTACEREWQWLYGGAASGRYPRAWTNFANGADDADLLRGYLHRLNDGLLSTQVEAAEQWCRWEDALIDGLDDDEADPAQPSTSSASLSSSMPAPFAVDHRRIALARIEAHYAKHRGFLREAALLDAAPRLASIRGVVVQGRCDDVTPPEAAVELVRRWPRAELQLIDDAGHASGEPDICDALIDATDRFAAP